MGPRKRFSPNYIDALRPRADRYFETDPEVEGLQLHVEPSGKKSWRWRFRWQGSRSKLTLGKWPQHGIADAHALVTEARTCLERGIDPRNAGIVGRHRAPLVTPEPTDDKPAPYSVAYLAREFMHRYVKPNRRRPEQVQRILDKDVLSVWRTRDARTITPREVVERLDGIVDRGSRVMANRVAKTLDQMFRFGIQRAIVEDSPVKLLMPPGGKEKPRERTLTDAELKAFLLNVDDIIPSPRTVRALRILLLTGVRRGELCAARWQDVRFDTATWHLPATATKTQTARDVPLSASALEEFRRLKILAGRSRYVFPTEDGSAPADAKLLTRSVARCAKAFKAKGVAPFRVHDLRRTLRTGLARLGIRPDIAELALGHKRDKLIETYDTHAYDVEVRAALDAWAAHFTTLAKVPA